MRVASLAYLGVTAGLFLIFAVIVFRTYRSKSKDRLEDPKNRMLEDD